MSGDATPFLFLVTCARCGRSAGPKKIPAKTCGADCGLAHLREANRKRTWKERALAAEAVLGQLRDAHHALETWRRP